nr:hypothetical protein [Tanacetum cinerariifolium]
MESLNSNSQEKELHQLQQMQDNAKESCMTSFQLLHSFLQVLSYDESKSKRVSERAFMTLFGQDNVTFTSTMFLYVDQLQNQLDKDEFQEDKSMAAFWVLNNQFQKFIDWQQYDRRMKERQMQSRESKVVSSKELDASLVVTECSGTKLDLYITSSSLWTYITHVVDADIRPVNDQEPSAEVHLTAQHNVLANEQQHTDQSETSYDTYLLEKVDSNTTPNLINTCHRGGEIDQDAEQYQFAKSSILGKPVLQPLRNQSVVRQTNSFRSKRPKFSKPRFASQVDVNNVLSKPVTPYYLPKVRESVFVKPNHVIASGSSRNSSKESYGSNDMAHNYYLEEAKKKTQDKNINLKASVMHTTSLQNTTNGSKPIPRRNNQTSRSFPVSKSSCGMSNGVPLVDNSSSFLDSKHFVCSTCQKCVFNANHDACLTKFLKEVNSRIKVQSSKSRNNIKPIEKITNVIKPKRWISRGHRVSLNKYISSGLVQNSVSPTSYVPPSKKDHEILFQPLFDEYFNHPPRAVSLVLAAVAAPRAVDPAGSPSSTIIDQDVPSANSSSEETTLQGFIPSIQDSCKTQFLQHLMFHHLRKTMRFCFNHCLFDEYFNPPPHAVSLVSVAIAAPRAVDPAGSPSSTIIDQDVPSASTSSTIQEIKSQVTHQAGSESRPPMLNKENYVPWSSRLLRYAKSRPNGKLIHNSILNGLYIRRMIPEPENYMPWSSRLLRYTKSRPNGKLIHNSILNGPYVRRMIPEPGDANRDVNVTETFHEQTDDELSEKELKQIEADDQAIQTILLDLPEDINAAVDSCETAQEIWLRVQQMMKGSDIGIQEKKAKLFNEWE